LYKTTNLDVQFVEWYKGKMFKSFSLLPLLWSNKPIDKLFNSSSPALLLQTCKAKLRINTPRNQPISITTDWEIDRCNEGTVCLRTEKITKFKYYKQGTVEKV